MNITEVRVKLVGNEADRLKAFCSVTLDGDFVIRDLKVIDGVNGKFVAMPSRKLTDRCRRCGCKNHLRARYCNECGNELPTGRSGRDGQSRTKLHADVAHPINSECRARIQSAVVEAYEEETEKAKKPGYKPVDLDDDYDYDDDELVDFDRTESPSSQRTKADDVPEDEEDDDEVGASEPSQATNSDEEVDDEQDDDGSDYNSLIADLKREAEARRIARRAEESTVPGAAEEEESEPDPTPEPALQSEAQEDGDNRSRQRSRKRRRGGDRSSPDSRPTETRETEMPPEETSVAATVQAEVETAPAESGKPDKEDSDPLAGFGAGIL